MLVDLNRALYRTVDTGIRFIEENHDFKLQSRAEQSKQRMPVGMPSQEMMSFWGYKFETC